jgi:hypothetical protein
MAAAGTGRSPQGRHASHVVRFRRSFLFGFAATIGERLAAATAAATARASEPTSTALVLADRSARVDEWVDATYGRLGTHRSSLSASSGGWSAGSAAAADADLHADGAVPAPTRALRS